MAQYIKHDFKKNFASFKKAKKFAELRDMIMDEVVKIIVFDKQGIIYTISLSGSSINREPTKKEILTYLYEWLPKSESLRKNIARLVLSYSQGEPAKKMQIGGVEVWKKPSLKNLSDGDVRTISEQLSFGKMPIDDVHEKLEQHIENKNIMEGKTISQEQLKKEIRKAYLKSAVLTLVIAGIGYYAYKKLGKHFIKKMEKGGDIDFPEQPAQPQPQPTQEIPTQPQNNSSEYDQYGVKKDFKA